MAGESLRIKGEITANEDLRFEGEIEGTISVPEHTLVVGRTARVHANVQAKAIVVAGSMMGSAVARERCEVQEAATVEGTVETPRLSIKEGACLTAQIADADAVRQEEGRGRSCTTTSRPRSPDIPGGGAARRPPSPPFGRVRPAPVRSDRRRRFLWIGGAAHPPARRHA